MWICFSVTSNPGLSQLSPYLNFDPAYLQTSQPEFIALEGASQKRGRFELAFSQIGGKMHKMVFKFVYKEGFCLYAYICTLPPLHMQILGYVHTHTEIISKHNWGRRLPYTRNFILDFCSDKDYIVMIVLKIFSLLLNSKELLSTPSTAIHVQVFRHQANFVFFDISRTQFHTPRIVYVRLAQICITRISVYSQCSNHNKKGRNLDYDWLGGGKGATKEIWSLRKIMP